MKSVKEFSLEGLVGSAKGAYQKAKAKVKDFIDYHELNPRNYVSSFGLKQKAVSALLMATLGLTTATIAKAGTWSDDFSDGVVGSRWSIVSDHSPLMIENASGLHLSGSSVADEIATATQYNGDQVLKVRFKAIDPVDFDYGVGLFASGSDFARVRVTNWTPNDRVVFDDGATISILSLTATNYFDILLQRASDIVSASVSQDGGAYQSMSGSINISNACDARMFAGFAAAATAYVQNFEWSGPEIPCIIDGDKEVTCTPTPTNTPTPTSTHTPTPTNTPTPYMEWKGVAKDLNGIPLPGYDIGLGIDEDGNLTVDQPSNTTTTSSTGYFDVIRAIQDSWIGRNSAIFVDSLEANPTLSATDSAKYGAIIRDVTAPFLDIEEWKQY